MVAMVPTAPALRVGLTGRRVVQRATPSTSIPHQGQSMNKDQVKGTLKTVAGEVQQKTGQLIGSQDQQIKGLEKQVEGRTQKVVGDIEEAVKDAGKK
jgi:uncharacterized protein YjbJ (UPF0337 family)